jgi:hypothetical protein
MLQDHNNRIDSILDMMDEKVEKSWVEGILSDKISKGEINDLLPDMKM